MKKSLYLSIEAVLHIIEIDICVKKFIKKQLENNLLTMFY
jgi:hypothetical protein